MAKKENKPYGYASDPYQQAYQTFDEYLSFIRKKRQTSPGVVPKTLRKKLEKHFGKNWEREYSPTGNIGGNREKILQHIDRTQKIKRARKGDKVKGYLAGDLINPLGGGTPGTPQGAGIGKGVAPQKKPQNPLAAQDALLKKKADQKKRIDLAGKPGTPQAPPKPGMAQKPPPVLGRKGGKIKMRKGDAVKSYSNICRSPVPRA
jgi:hypothetical protein